MRDNVTASGEGENLRFSFPDEPEDFSSRRDNAHRLIQELEMPESIRTPGRTWTRYPYIEIDTVELVEPEIDVEGSASVHTGGKAVEKADDKLLDAVKPGENRLNAIHTARMNSLVHIEATGDADIEIVYDEETPVFAHLVVETDESSELNITEKFHGSGRIQTSFNELYIGENSTVNFGAVESFEAELSYAHRKAVLSRNASVNWLNAQFSGAINRTKIETVLKGDGSSTEKTGVWYPVDDQHFDLALEVYHRGENTKCDMDSRAVVDDRARSVYEGLQQVGDSAENTKSFQDQKTLMLSDSAEDDASPKLMIENPDVEASHAASSGGVPGDELHYLKSRGIPREQARRLVVKGYFEPVMEQITLPDLKNSIREEVEKKL